MKSLSVIIPVYNEQEILEKNSLELLNYLKNLKKIENFEILLCDNGSTDSTFEIAKKLGKKYMNIRALSAGKKGIGLGIKLGIENAKYDLCFFYAIDLPFGLHIIEESLNAMHDNVILINSKEHENSKRISFDFKRILFSRTYNFLINLFFNLGINDTQGSLMFHKKDLERFFGFLDSEDAFFQTQILVYGKLYNMRIKEIPVDYTQPRKEGSKICVLKDGWSMLKQILHEYLKYRKLRAKNE